MLDFHRLLSQGYLLNKFEAGTKHVQPEIKQVQPGTKQDQRGTKQGQPGVKQAQGKNWTNAPVPYTAIWLSVSLATSFPKPF